MTPQPFYRLKEPPEPIEFELGGLQNLSKQFGEYKLFLPLPRLETWTFPPSSLVIVSTEVCHKIKYLHSPIYKQFYYRELTPKINTVALTHKVWE
jgi:hypothetical protein